MLELRDITKIYPAGGANVSALKGISLRFRKSEFVSILGPSGCGKTTMLNIIGGLDKYTSGDLIINGKSTKEYKDRDWDSYRNHSIGFVFQSYNLIPHQSVLQNVELALTLSGVSKKERRARAKAALERVGLGDQLRKKPNEMSGGQMQRVAIARAIVNNPDIVLADEPTGALDTETSVQVMEILKEISTDRLVIMVTHNPELAEKYSTRIVRMLDGNVLGDSLPMSDEEIAAENAEIEAANAEKGKKRDKKPSMSFSTAFGLSLKNLFTKKGRTLLTGFAGSIGIIGIALIYAVSNGMTTYIDTVQEETLSSYPLTIESQHVDISTLLTTFMGKAHSIEPHENDAVYQKAMLYELVNSLTAVEEQDNDLKSFKKYITDEIAAEDSKLSQAVSSVQYTYDFDLLIYTKNIDGEIIHSDLQHLMRTLLAGQSGISSSANSGSGSSMSGGFSSLFGSSSMMSSMSSGSKLWHELMPGKDGQPVNDITTEQYELLYGSWPNSYDEIILFVDQNNELSDLTLYALGLKSEDDIRVLMDAAMNKETVEYETQKWSYEELVGIDFRTVMPYDCYTKDEASGLYTDLRDTQAGMKYLYDNGLTLHVVGIAKPGEDALAASATGSIGYTYLLTDYIIENCEKADSVIAQKADTLTDIFTGLPFADPDGNIDNAKKAADFREYISTLDETAKSSAYVSIKSIPSDEQISQAVDATLSGMTREDMEAAMTEAMSSQMGMDADTISSYISSMTDDDMNELFAQSIKEQFKAQYAAGVAEQMSAMTVEQLAGAFDMESAAYTDDECAKYYDEVLEFSESTYEENLATLGYADTDNPSTINIYASSFENKDLIEEAIAEYNETVDELSEIGYTDYVGIMMSSITTIINAITYVLIAFVAVSLVVSSIMIGVITLISVQERTKEIGILRAIGASKKNVSSMFNAETVIIGFLSGLIGVGVTWLLIIPINAILHALTGIGNLSAILPINVAVTLIVISMLLTLIAGVIPSGSAAKKDPVVALRTE